MKKKKSLILKEVLSYSFFATLFLFAGIGCVFKMGNTKLDLTILGFLFVILGIVILFFTYKINVALVHDGQYLYNINLLRQQKKICKLSEIEIIDLNNINERVVLGNLPINRNVFSIYQIKTPKGRFFIHEKKYNDIVNFILSLK